MPWGLLASKAGIHMPHLSTHIACIELALLALLKNLETHLLATSNRHTPQTPSLQVDGNAESKLTGASRSVRSLTPSEEGRQGNESARALQKKATVEGECDGPGIERIDENVDSARHQDGQSEAQGSFDLNNTIHSRHGEKFSDDLRFSTGAQASDNGTAGLLEGMAQQNHLPSHMIPAVREWLRGQGLSVHLPSSPLGPRLSKKTMDRRNGHESSRPPWRMTGDPTGQGGAAAVTRLEDGTQPNTGP